MTRSIVDNQSRSCSLKWILENDVTHMLDLTFTVTQEKFGELKEVELVENGANILVTEDNKKKYVELLVEWRFHNSVQEQMDAFNCGFFSIVPRYLVQIFDEKELELLLGGIAEIDVEDWKRYTEYRGGYSSEHQVVLWFWSVVEDFDNEMRARLLQFVTGTSRMPVNGFRELHGNNGPQRFCLERAATNDGLCRAHTCFNRLNLPEYPSLEKLRERLLFSIDNTTGFLQE
ncbi:hypothetical protein Zmor_012234 [Zophobas morio]|uniref:HECT-type E3 ubiquitin transferase n=1 Tax=Zophobas morio TaxID=2755281 RepID=A0AA38HI31_9CUCU|nr:hypothetical protein Zmor_012234 [Zophobas morio]